MKRMSVPVENMAEIIWGALLVGYLVFSGNPAYLQPTVLVVFLLSGSAAFIEIYLRKIRWHYLLAFDTIVWTILLSAMVAVTGGRGSEVWPAYLLMSLTAPSVDGRSYAYLLLGANSALYTLIYLFWDPAGSPFHPALLGMRIGLFFLVAWVVDRSMMRERKANEAILAVMAARVTELTEARDAERRRVASDIHDWLGTGIIAPIRKLELAQRAPSPEAAGARVGEAIQILTRSHSELRRVMENLHPHLLEQMGLADALESYLTQWGEEHQTATAFTVAHGPEPANQLAVTLFRILQESLNNCAKHAESTQVKVALQVTSDLIDLEISDNGRGFATERPTGSGRGLTGMRERATVYGGTLQVHSTPGQGTTIRASFPFQ
ncbi:MAG TPA: sensor histidine kinase [Symbiobacteriaceae bacterium]|nr:sensor histidine kinase [Symbiobacteriaceae bacterium]